MTGTERRLPNDAGTAAVGTCWADVRVLIVSSSYPFHRDDYRVRFVHDMARQFADASAAVHVLTPWTPDSPTGEETWDGVTVERFRYPMDGMAPLTGGMGIVENLRASPARIALVPTFVRSFANQIRTTIDRIEPDVVVSHWLVPGGWATSVAKPRVPTIHVAHSSDVHLLARLRLGRLIGKRIRKAGRIVAPSRYLLDEIKVHGIDPAPSLLRLGVEEPPPAASSYAERLASPRRICTMGRLLPGKGLTELIDLAQRIPGLRVTIAGSGPMRAPLAVRIKNAGMGDRIQLCDPVLGSDKIAFLRSHDLFAFLAPRPTSRFQDNLPIAVLEAMSCGLPVVATRVGALPELLTEGGGLLVEHDPRAAASSIAGLSDETLIHMSEMARTSARRRNWPDCLQAMFDLTLATRRAA